MAEHGAGTSSSAAAGAGDSGSASPRAPALLDPAGRALVDDLLDVDVAPQAAAALNVNPQQVDAYVSTLAAEISRAPPAVVEADLLDNIINTDVSQIVMSPEEMDQAVAAQQALNNQFRSAMETGKYVERVLDTLVEGSRWLHVAEYLGKFVRYHAADSVLPVPASTRPEDVHAQLFLSPHAQCIYELIAGGDRAAAQRHFSQYLAPLRASCAHGYVRNLFTKVELTMKGTLYDLPNVAEAARQAAVEIKDYIFLYFPILKPKLRPSRGKEPSPLWMFGELVHRSDGVRGFRCFSCHQVVWYSAASHLRNHLEGRPGTVHCPAVAQCTLDRLAAIPRP